MNVKRLLSYCAVLASVCLKSSAQQVGIPDQIRSDGGVFRTNEMVCSFAFMPLDRDLPGGLPIAIQVASQQARSDAYIQLIWEANKRLDLEAWKRELPILGFFSDAIWSFQTNRYAEGYSSTSFLFADVRPIISQTDATNATFCFCIPESGIDAYVDGYASPDWKSVADEYFRPYETLKRDDAARLALADWSFMQGKWSDALQYISDYTAAGSVVPTHPFSYLVNRSILSAGDALEHEVDVLKARESLRRFGNSRDACGVLEKVLRDQGRLFSSAWMAYSSLADCPAQKERDAIIERMCLDLDGMKSPIADELSAYFKKIGSVEAPFSVAEYPVCARLYQSIGSVSLSPFRSLAALDSFKAGEKHFESKNWVEALPHLYASIEVNPFMADSHNLAGSCLVREGKHLEATPFLLQAININSSHKYAYANLAICFKEIGYQRLAVMMAAEALKCNPEDPWVQGVSKDIGVSGGLP